MVTFSWGLLAVLLLLAVVITVLMRPDIFSTTLRGGGEKKALKRSAMTDEEFQARLRAGQDDRATGGDKKEVNNG